MTESAKHDMKDQQNKQDNQVRRNQWGERVYSGRVRETTRKSDPNTKQLLFNYYKKIATKNSISSMLHQDAVKLMIELPLEYLSTLSIPVLCCTIVIKGYFLISAMNKWEHLNSDLQPKSGPLKQEECHANYDLCDRSFNAVFGLISAFYYHLFQASGDLGLMNVSTTLRTCYFATRLTVTALSKHAFSESGVMYDFDNTKDMEVLEKEINAEISNNQVGM